MALHQAFGREGFHAPVGPVAYLSLATLSQTGSSLAQQGVAVLSLFFATEYHLSLAQMGGFVTAQALGGMASRMVMGILVDRLGPRRLLLGASLAMAAMAIVEALVHNLWLTLVVLFFLGGFLSAAPACGTKAVLIAWTGRARGLPMGIRQTGVPIGAMLAASLLPGMAARFGPHPIYFGLSLVLLGCGWAFAWAIPAEVRHTASVRQTMPRSWQSIRQSWLPAAVGFWMAWAQYDVLTYSIPFLHTHQGLTLATAGVVLAVSQAGGAVGRVVVGAVSDGVGGRRANVLAVVTSMALVGALGVGFLPSGIGWGWLVGVWFYLGITMVGWNALLLTWAGEQVPAAASGTAMSTIGSCVALGSAVAPPLFGLMVGWAGYRGAWFMLATAIAVAAALIWSRTDYGIHLSVRKDPTG